MAVRDVHNPETKHPIDPKVVGEKKEGEEGYWEKQKREARAKREFKEEEKMIENLERPKEAAEPAFSVKGSVNLGNIDFQKQQDELKLTMERIQNDAQSQIQALNQQNANYRDEMHKIQLEMVEKTLKAQIESMQKTIQEGLIKPRDKSITDQISEITQIAGVLGYARPDPQSGLPAELQLKMLEIEMAEKTAARKFEWDKMMSERNWQLELKKLEIGARTRQAEIEQEEKKRSMFITPFESIGAAIAKGLIDSNGGAGDIRGQSKGQAKRKRSEFKLQANEGDSGTVDCPECREPIAIAPTARSAVCPSCEATISVTRIPKQEA